MDVFYVEDPQSSKRKIILTYARDMYNMSILDMNDDDDELQCPNSNNFDDFDDLSLTIGIDLISWDILSKMCLGHEILSLGWKLERNIIAAITWYHLINDDEDIVMATDSDDGIS